MTERSKTIFGTVCFGFTGTSGGLGFWMIVHSMKHLGDVTEATVTGGFEHIGNFTGSPHGFSLFVGAILVGGAMWYTLKVFKQMSIQTFEKAVKPEGIRNRLTHTVTESGKKVAEAMKQFSVVK